MRRQIASAADDVADPLAIDAELVARMLRGFIGDEVRKVGYQRVVIGLSGGVDSALVATLAVQALGADAVVPVIMPYRHSDPGSEADARSLCDQLGLHVLVVDISPQIDAYFERFCDADRHRRGNKMARERMTVLYDMSSLNSALVLGTSNKTELLLGYGTVFGDMAHALNPVGDLYKTQVFALSRHLGLPARIIAKPPSADLFVGQSDEEDLGFRYVDADRVLFALVDERRRPAELRSLGLDTRLIDVVAGRIRDNQYKRRLPIIAKLSARTIDRDFRYPRDWGR